nr:pilus assembly protein [Actinomycetota bacterium]
MSGPGVAGEEGGAAVEVAIVAPLLIVMLLFVVGLGRLAAAREVIDGAARDAAREASIRRSSGRAVAEAED